MKQNVGWIDRAARFVIGAAILSVVFWGPQTAWGYIGLMALLSAISGFCPLYKLMGVATCPYHPPREEK